MICRVIDKEGLRALKSRNEKVFIQTGLKFIDQHKGFRPGKVHTIMGKPSGGKSTIMRTILKGVCKSLGKDEKIFLWLSEESEEDFLTALSYDDVLLEYGDQIIFCSEVHEQYDKYRTDAFTRIEEVFLKEKPKLFIYDNLTTSKLYSEDFKIQTAVSQKLKSMAIEHNMPMLLFAHTKSSVLKNQLIDLNDIRGSRAIVNLSEFFYILQNFEIGKNIYNTVRVCKHRNQEIRDRMFLLNYEATTLTYKFDVELDFDEIKQLFKKSNKF